MARSRREQERFRYTHAIVTRHLLPDRRGTMMKIDGDLCLLERHRERDRVGPKAFLSCAENRFSQNEESILHSRRNMCYQLQRTILVTTGYNLQHTLQTRQVSLESLYILLHF